MDPVCLSIYAVHGYSQRWKISVEVYLYYCKYYHTGQLPQIRPNPVKILAGAGFGRITKKGPDAGFAGAGAEIRYIPILYTERGHATVSRLSVRLSVSL